MDCSTGKGGKVSGDKNRDKKVVMVKLIIQKKKPHTHKNTPKDTRYRNNKKFIFWVKVQELFLRCSILVLAYKWEL
jgi:hypothetical protein